MVDSGNIRLSLVYCGLPYPCECPQRKWTLGPTQPISHAQRLLTANGAFQLGFGSSQGQHSVLGRSSALVVPENVGFHTSGLPAKRYAHPTLNGRRKGRGLAMSIIVFTGAVAALSFIFGAIFADWTH